jgi:hypothetical protein
LVVATDPTAALKLEGQMRRFSILLFAALLVGCGSCDDIAGQKACASDANCAGEQTCQQGECVTPWELVDPTSDGNTNDAAPGNSTTTNNATTSQNGRTASPDVCIEVTPNPLRLSTVAGTRVEERLSVYNCGQNPVELYTATSDRDVFETPDEVNVQIASATSYELPVRFLPDRSGTYEGEIRLHTNGGDISVPVEGESVECPTAIAEARVGDSGEWTRVLDTTRGKTVRLRGTDSIGADQYEWRLIEHPPQSTAMFEPHREIEEPTLYLDRRGHYTVQLTVSSDDGTESCGEPALIQIDVRPDSDICVELAWDTPGDDDQSDEDGTDLDLHFLHPNGTWDTPPYDIFWRNPTNEWGAPGPADDPRLDIDDTGGAGPELICLDGPEAGLSYAVGVYYYSGDQFGPSDATVRILLRGMQQFEQTKRLPSNGTFWYVAAITWPSQTISMVGTVQQGFPESP